MRSIYVALDFASWEEASEFIHQNELQGVPVKVGMELFYREGPSVIEKLKADGHPIFLDLKLHDIPTTVQRAMENIARLEVDMVNVHALGGSRMIAAAKEGLLRGHGSAETKLIAVTILTSTDVETMNRELRLSGEVIENVVHLADLSRASGADGVVCSVHESVRVKQACGQSFLTVTPGIRLPNSDAGDQKRVATPKDAKDNLADFIVIGRSITKAAVPKAAYQQALEALK